MQGYIVVTHSVHRVQVLFGIYSFSSTRCSRTRREMAAGAPGGLYEDDGLAFWCYRRLLGRPGTYLGAE